MSDPALQNYAVFANSNQAVVKSTAKSVVSIPFQTNLAVHDPHKMFKFALSMVKYTNSVYNIDTSNNTLQFAVEFAPGRGFLEGNLPAQTYHRWQTWTVRIPPGAYDIIELSNILSEGRYIYDPTIGSAYANRAGYEVSLQPFQYANEEPTVLPGPVAPGNGGSSTSNVDIFVGFGAIPINANDPTQTKAALSIDNNSKMVFQSPDMAHLIQYGVDITTPCTNRLPFSLATPNPAVSEQSLDYSYIYKGVYLLFNTNTAPMLKLLGFFNIDSVPAPVISGYISNTNAPEQVTGYGLTFIARTQYNPYPVYINGVLQVPQAPFDPQTDRYAKDNITTYALSEFLLGGSGVETFLPTLPNTIPFAGHFGNETLVGENTPFLSTLYQANAANNAYVTVPPGYTLQGAGILPPLPQVLTNQNTKVAFTFERIICSRDKADVTNYRWNYDATNAGTLANSLLDTEVGIWGDIVVGVNPPNNGQPPAGIQMGQAITFYGDGLGDANAYLDNTNAQNTNLYSYIIKSGIWRDVASGPTGGIANRNDWIYCMELTISPQLTPAIPLPARLNTLYGNDVDPLGVIDTDVWLRAEPNMPNPENPATILSYMGYYNLQFQTNRLTINNPQQVTTIDPTITYTNFLATNVSLNDITSLVIPKNLSNLEGLDEIHIHCAQLRTKHLASTSFQPLAPSDVIGVVPVDVPFGSKGTWQPPVPLESYIANTNIVALDFRLTDSSNRLLDFNGLDWSMVFNCQEVDVLPPNMQQGTINTPFQDQLATMEGTAQAQVRSNRKRGAAHELPLQFIDPFVDPKRTGYNK